MSVGRMSLVVAALFGASLAGFAWTRSSPWAEAVHSDRATPVIGRRGSPPAAEPVPRPRIPAASPALRDRVRRQASFLARIDDRRILAQFHALGRERERILFLRGLFRRRADGNLPALVVLALKFHGRDRDLALRTLLAKWSPSAAGKDKTASAARRLSALLAADPANDLGFLLATTKRLLPGQDPSDVLGRRLFQAANVQPDAAARALADLPESPARQQILAQIGRRWAAQDTATALAWADQLPANDRASARAAIQSTAPVGIGVALSTSRSSPYPLAAETVSGGPAARSGGINPGDQIVAVMDSQHRWSDTAGRDLPDVIGLIRGSSGQPVQIRVLSSGSNDPARARTITLVREQILFKNQGG